MALPNEGRYSGNPLSSPRFFTATQVSSIIADIKATENLAQLDALEQQVPRIRNEEIEAALAEQRQLLTQQQAPAPVQATPPLPTPTGANNANSAAEIQRLNQRVTALEAALAAKQAQPPQEEVPPEETATRTTSVGAPSSSAYRRQRARQAQQAMNLRRQNMRVDLLREGHTAGQARRQSRRNIGGPFAGFRARRNTRRALSDENLKDIIEKPVEAVVEKRTSRNFQPRTHGQTRGSQ